MKALLVGLLCLLPVKAGTEKFCVDPASSEALNKVANPPLAVCDSSERQKVPTPSVNLQVNVASATRAPWIVANGWRFLRDPGGKYRYETVAGKASLAMAEAFAYDVNAGFKLEAADVDQAARMLTFLRALPEIKLLPIADFAFVDDGSAGSGEAMNLLSRRNLLYAAVKQPDSKFSLNVTPGSADFPAKLIANPAHFAAAVRTKLTDEKRSIRIYGSEVAILRALSHGKAARVHVLNYINRPLDGVRLRIRGTFSKGDLHRPGSPDGPVADLAVDDGFTEFTVPEMNTYGVIDLR